MSEALKLQERSPEATSPSDIESQAKATRGKVICLPPGPVQPEDDKEKERRGLENLISEALELQKGNRNGEDNEKVRSLLLKVADALVGDYWGRKAKEDRERGILPPVNPATGY
jgi:hypothetical protein